LGRNDLAHVEPEEITSKASRGIIKKLSEEVEPNFVYEEVLSTKLKGKEKEVHLYKVTEA